MSNAEQIASALKCADRHAPQPLSKLALTREDKVRLVRSGLIVLGGRARAVEQTHKVRPEQIADMQMLRASGATLEDIANRFGVSITFVHRHTT